VFDEDIRFVLKCFLRDKDGTAAILEELPLLRGRGRADLAFVNGELCGYEIKSDADSLVRLGTQTDHYQSVFEFVTLVAARKHLKHARKRIPRSWGIIEAQEINGQVILRERRKPQRNRFIDKAALARILWKKECLRILSKLGMRTSSCTPVREIWRLIESLPSQTLCDEVRQALKARFGIAEAPKTQRDDSSTIVAIESVPQALPSHP
jgi:hypothetical protein